MGWYLIQGSVTSELILNKNKYEGLIRERWSTGIKKDVNEMKRRCLAVKN